MRATIEITIGKGERATTTKHEVDSDDMPLVLLEALQDNNTKAMREGIAEFLNLSEEEGRHLTIRHVKAIGAALQEAQASPNA